tara:strand:- start:20286 stop:20516 length:231 start_codon:yes stop_codon:yes gene_type:complete
MDKLRILIEATKAIKHGNKEFALFCLGPCDWVAMIGNPTEEHMLGENPGEFESEGYETPDEAVKDLLSQMLRIYQA